MGIKLINFLCLVTFTCHTVLCQVEVDTTTLLQQLDEVIILATRLPTEQLKSARSIYRRDLSQSNRHNQQLTMDEALWHLPGVYAVNPLNFSQDLRISIRGFGSRAAFGVRGVKILLDGIPATTPDGQSQLDHFDPGRISRVELLSGSGSSLYGNAAGGVLDFRTRRHLKSMFGGGIKLGSNGLSKINLSGAKVTDGTTYQGSINFAGYGGYREHSRAQTYAGDAAVFKTIPSGEMTFRLNVTHSPKAQDPGGINLQQVVADRRSARDRNVLFNGGEEITRASVSWSIDKKIQDDQDIDINSYYLIRDFNNRLPFENGGMVSFFRNYFGTQAKYQIRGKNHHLLLGLDLEHQSDLRRRHDNLEGIRGDETLHQLEHFSLLGFYGQEAFDFAEKWRIEATLRLDLIRLGAKDRFLTDGDQSGRSNLSHLSPSLGLNYAWQKFQHLFIRFGHSFETPSLTELSNNPDGSGGFNLDLLPQKANHFEFGAKGRSGSWRYEMALFYIDLDNELIPFELGDFPGRTFYQNSGSSNRTGLELSLGGNISDVFSFNLSYTYSKFQFKDFEIDGANFDDQKLPGVPQHFASSGLQYRSEGGFFVGLDFNYTGELFANNANTVKVDHFALLHLRLGQTWQTERGNWSISAGVRNLAGSDYFDNIRINAFGARYYEPGAKSQLFVGVDFEI